ncbi:hypothetical protein BC332_27883 [Capsicum chinense]|nr:hypothetical protein BC332_27883 [Capsicum chinense]
MKTLFKSQDLWDLIETGYADSDEKQRLKKNKKKDAKALFFLQQIVHETQEDGTGQANSRSFRSMVGGLVYLSHIYPDISYSVGVVSRFMSNPLKHHFRAAKRILHYIAGTLEHDIWYSRISNFRLVGYPDSD